MKSRFTAFCYATLAACSLLACNRLSEIQPGAIWPDTEGRHINAHGGGVLRYGDAWWWFGEHKADSTNKALVGVTCYRSKDLINWKYEGVALAVSEDPDSPITRECVIERPKVIYNEKTGKFVMWFHLEHKGHGYKKAHAAVAVADNVTGPYSFVRCGRVNAGKWPCDWSEADIEAVQAINMNLPIKAKTPEWIEESAKGRFLRRDFEGGQMARDQTVFVDDDGKAYHIFSSEENMTLHIAELSDDYLTHTGRYVRVAPGDNNEAPAIFKKDGTYWMITSGCTGWKPNKARMFSAPHIFGPWTKHDNPCVGPDADLTFQGQSTYILPVPGSVENEFIFMADIWRPKHPIDGRYIWLPITWKDGKPVVQWQDRWKPKT